MDGNSISELRGCHLQVATMLPATATRSTQVNTTQYTPRLKTSRTGRYLISLARRDGRLSGPVTCSS